MSEVKNQVLNKVPEATKQQLESPEVNVQNTLKGVLPLPNKEAGYEFAEVTKAMKEANVFQIQRKEIKTSKGFYERLEKIKKRK